MFHKFTMIMMIVMKVSCCGLFEIEFCAHLLDMVYLDNVLNLLVYKTFFVSVDCFDSKTVLSDLGNDFHDAMFLLLLMNGYHLLNIVFLIIFLYIT